MGLEGQKGVHLAHLRNNLHQDDDQTCAQSHTQYTLSDISNVPATMPGSYATVISMTTLLLEYDLQSESRDRQ